MRHASLRQPGSNGRAVQTSNLAEGVRRYATWNCKGTGSKTRQTHTDIHLCFRYQGHEEEKHIIMQISFQVHLPASNIDATIEVNAAVLENLRTGSVLCFWTFPGNS